MNIRPLGDRILVKRIQEKQISRYGLRGRKTRVVEHLPDDIHDLKDARNPRLTSESVKKQSVASVT